MDGFQVVQFVQRLIRNRKEQVMDLLENNNLTSMEQYRELMGNLSSLNYIAQELTDLLDKQERLDDGSSGNA